MWIRNACVTAIALTVTSAAFAQEYFDFGRIRGLPDNPAVQVDLNPMMLGLVTAASRAANPAAASLLAGVAGVRVRVYTSLIDIDEVVGSMDEISKRLENDSWQQVVRVQEDGDVRIYMRADRESITGLTAMIVADENAVFVNVNGTFTPEQIAQLVESVGHGEMLASLGLPGTLR
jgi:hypothetical protein